MRMGVHALFTSAGTKGLLEFMNVRVLCIAQSTQADRRPCSSIQEGSGNSLGPPAVDPGFMSRASLAICNSTSSMI